MIELRPYQQTAVEEIRTALSQYRRVLFQLVTGGGKTICFSYIVSQSQRLNRKVLILSSRTEILKQNGGALERMGLDIDYITPQSRNVPTKNIACGMAQTMKRRVEKQEWLDYLSTIEICVIDECHEQTGDFVHHLLSPSCFVLGVTATPRRYGQAKQLGDMYSAMVTGVTAKELIGLGFLSSAKLYSIAAPKLDIPIDYARGEYNQKALAAKFEDRTLYVGVVNEYLRLIPHKKTICFCVSAKQAIELTKEFSFAGVSARYLLSGSFDDDSAYSGTRSEVIDDFAAGRFDVLVNVGIAVAGLDIVSIEAVILNFSTLSITKYLQAIGRASRVTETKHEFTILDCGENYKRHGVYDMDREWCLYHDSGSGEGVLITKDCDPNRKDINGKFGCGAKMPSTVKVCKKCGWVFPTDKHEIIMHLEEVAESEEQDMVSWAAQKKLDGWKLSRILIQVCSANVGNEKKAFTEVYCKLYNKTEAEANKYWFVFRKNVWDKIKRKRDAASYASSGSASADGNLFK